RSQQERAARDFALFSEEALPDRASVASKTADQRERVWAKWELWAKNVVNIDPNQTWLDFCLHCNTATTYIRMFLKAYVENSYELRVCLGPEENEWVRMVSTGVALMDVWKSLVGSADMKVLQKKRQEEPHNQAQWKLVFHEGRGQTSNPAYKVSLTRIAFHAVLLLSSIGGFRPGTLMQMPFSQISITVIPWPLLCIVSQVIVVALEKNALETPFSSMDEILCRPILEDVDYIPLRWKKDMENQTLFEITYPAFYDLWYQVLLVAGVREPPRPYSMRVGAGGRLHNENAPIYPKKEDIKSWEQRSDLRKLRIEYETLRRRTAADRPETKRVAAQIQSMRDKLEELTIDRDRKAYFERVDTLRASGMPIPGELSQSSESHRRRFHEASSQGAAAIGKFLCQKTPHKGRTADFVRMGLAYLSKLPASAQTIADRCLTASPEARLNVRSPPVPVERPLSDAGENEQTHSCMFGCGTYKSRPNLTRHTLNVHIAKGQFEQPFECPECARSGRSSEPINTPSAWSHHIAKDHGVSNAPYLPTYLSPIRRHTPKRREKAERLACLLCGLAVCVGNSYSRHTNRAHKHAGLFNKTFSCIICQQNEGRQFTVDGFESWTKHAWDCHGRDSQTG
ncbi:hypothetical protein BDP81DRAFT_279256, partial [Colletotrichum phormii]